MIKKYRHIIWDWNGTIFNDVELSVDLINSLLRQYQLKTVSLSEYRNIFTIPVREYYEKIGFDFSRDSFEVIGKLWMDEYERRKFECDLYEGIRDVFEKINSLNIRQSILSAYSQHTLDEMVRHYNLQKYFDNVAGLDNIYAASKLHLGVDLIKRVGCKPEEVLLIGDTLHDLEVATAIGANCALLTCGHQSKEKFSSYCQQDETLKSIRILDSADNLFG
ncbi:MAG: HAD family hydrolase [Bacillota bacterium]